MPQVSAILVNYHAEQDTCRCLEHLYSQSVRPDHLCIVDNACTKESRLAFESFKSSHLDIPLLILSNEKNPGFAVACNQGIIALQEQGFSGFFWLVNNDTIADKDALQNLLITAETEKSGITGSRIQLPNGVIGGSAQIHPFWGSVKRTVKFTNSEYEYIEGSSFLISQECLDKIGLLPENYFLYFEETDYCFAAKKAGLSLALAENSIIKHDAGKSTGSERGKGCVPIFIDCLIIRNRIFFCRKYEFPKIGIFLALFISLLLRARRRQWSRIVTILRIAFSSQNFKKFIRDNGGIL